MRAAVERTCGSSVVEALTQPGGFSPGVAARVRCADGRRFFVKAASADVNADAPRLHRQEARVLADLDPLIITRHLPVPRLIGTAEHGHPWQDGQLDLVLAAVGLLAENLTGVRVDVPAIAEYLGDDFTGWRKLSSEPLDDRIDPWSRGRLTELAALEGTWPAHVAGPDAGVERVSPAA